MSDEHQMPQQTALKQSRGQTKYITVLVTAWRRATSSKKTSSQSWCSLYIHFQFSLPSFCTSPSTRACPSPCPAETDTHRITTEGVSHPSPAWKSMCNRFRASDKRESCHADVVCSGVGALTSARWAAQNAQLQGTAPQVFSS